MRALDRTALDAKAQVMVTTEKDWAKLATLPAAARTATPIWRVELAIHFRAGDDEKLLGQIRGKSLTATSPASSSPAVSSEG